MGAGQSTSQLHPPSRALHVLRVTPLSPASKTTIEPYFDFVVGFEGDSLSSEHNIDVLQLERIVEQHEGRTLNLLIWNSKNQHTRVVPIIPSRVWSQSQINASGSSQNHESVPQPSLLGLSMRICEPETATENVWHVLDVLEGSPAESAGLVPMGDWILGWSGGVLNSENDFYDLVEAHIDKPLRVYVYSHDFDALREVVLIPNRHWGGEGLLGCVFGFGLLHRIPSQPVDRLPGTTPIELQRAAEEYEEQELFVPADVHSERHFSPEQLADWRKQEQEQWHQETLAAQSLYEPPEPEPRVPSSSRMQAAGRDHIHYIQHHDHTHRFNPDGHSGDEGTLHRSQPTDGSLTPTRIPAGPFMNGYRDFQNLRQEQLLPARVRGASSRLPADETGEDDEAGYDGEASVAGTETSRGSLTSVD